MTASAGPAPADALQRLLAWLDRAGLPPWPAEIADALWLSTHLPPETGDSDDPPVPGAGRTDNRLSDQDHRRPDVDPDDTEPPSRPRSMEHDDLERRVPAARVYPAGPATRGQTPARTFFAPGAPLLPQALELGRALRRLRRVVPSRARQELDETATVEQSAEQGQFCAIHRRTPERWLELALVIDGSPTMWVWGQTLDAVARLLQHHGAFRRVRVWHLDASGRDPRLHPGRDRRSRRAHPRELQAPHGRGLILVASDCVAPSWHSRTLIEMLRAWGETAPTALLHMLPPHRWPQTGIGRGRQLRLYRGTTSGNNTGLRYQEVEESADQPLPPDALKLPILTLEPGSFATWATLLTGTEPVWIAGYGFGPETRYAAEGWPPDSPPTPETIQRRLDRFLATAPPRAQRLAGYLAATPLALPVMRLVQRVMLPHGTPLDLAELAVSGLLRQVSPHEARPRWLHYEFHDGIRDELARLVPARKGAEVLLRLSRYVAERTGGSINFQALLADPEAAGGLTLDPDSRYFAELAAPVLRRLGGGYQRLADRLIGPGPAPSPPPVDPTRVDELTRILSEVYEKATGSAPDLDRVRKNGLSWLVDKVRGYVPDLPEDVITLGKSALKPAAEMIEKAILALGRWLQAPSPTAAALDAEAAVPPSDEPLPSNWARLVETIREYLFSPPARGPFGGWSTPTTRWHSPWTEACEVHDAQGTRAIALVPSRDAAGSRNAEAAWSRRVEAAHTLRTKVTDPSFASVRTAAPGSTPGFVLLNAESDPTCIVFERNPRLDAVQAIELAITLCNRLQALNERRVRILDLSPRWISFRWEHDDRSVLLLDPTAVVADPDWLPERRGTLAGPWDGSENDLDRAQVFLVGALTLQVLLGADRLERPIDTSGRSATLAALLREPGLEDTNPLTVAEELAHRLVNRFPLRIDARKIALELSRSVHEDPMRRQPNLRALGANLQQRLPAGSD